jgi:hypothetical protein
MVVKQQIRASGFLLTLLNLACHTTYQPCELMTPEKHGLPYAELRSLLIPMIDFTLFR